MSSCEIYSHRSLTVTHTNHQHTISRRSYIKTSEKKDERWKRIETNNCFSNQFDNAAVFFNL